MRIEIKEIGAQDVLPLRSLILRPGRPFEECIWPGDERPDSFHLGAFVDGELASIASFYDERHEGVPASRKHYRLRGMATIESARKQKLGTKLLLAGLERIRDAEGDLLWCNARVPVAGFYYGLGFTQIGEPFDMPPVGPHVLMYKKL